MISNPCHPSRRVVTSLSGLQSYLPARLVAVVFVLLLVEAGGYTHAAVFSGQVLDYQQKTIYHSPETPGYTSWVGLWKLPNGTIQTDFVQATGPQSSPVVTYPALQSTNNGQTWTRIAGDTPPAGYSRGMAVLPDGTMVRPDWTGYNLVDGYMQYPAGKFMGIRRSITGGVSWSQPISLVTTAGYQLSIPTLIKPLRDGRLVAMAGLTPNGVSPNLAVANMEKAMLISSDQGLSWSAPITLMPVSTGACEESDFVELPSGDLLWVHRAVHYTADGYFLSQERLQSITKKVGDTFEPQAPTTLSGEVVGFPCLMMTSEGVILDLGMAASRGSDDEGKIWHDLLVGGQQLRTGYYPQAVQANDGTIVVVSHIGCDDGYGTVDQSIKAQTFRLSALELPEPSALTLLGIGAFSLLAYFWRLFRV